MYSELLLIPSKSTLFWLVGKIKARKSGSVVIILSNFAREIHI